MDFFIIDRRKNGKNKSSENKRKFLRRYKRAISEAVKRSVAERSISDVDKDGAKVYVSRNDIDEPSFSHDYNTGIRKGVNPGNIDFVAGDKIRKQYEGEGEGSGNGSGNGGGGDDEFAFTLTKEEFMDYFFDDLELPNMIKTNLAQSEEYQWKRAGVSTVGVPSNLDLVRSMRSSLGRRVALKNPHKKEVTRLQLELEELLAVRECDRSQEQIDLIAELEDRISFHSAKASGVPFIDPLDLRYRVHAKELIPVTSAVMICVMDVSGSMGQHEKDLAKRFFMLLHLFLERNYKKVEIRFVRHHHEAMEVDEDTFFHARDSGGTLVSPALSMVKNMIETEYSDGSWNVYVAQASDGDNWYDDQTRLGPTLRKLLPAVQYFAYLEVGHQERDASEIWQIYEPISRSSEKLNCAKAQDPSHIYPVLRQLFEAK